jgi:hypothetical protein
LRAFRTLRGRGSRWRGHARHILRRSPSSPQQRWRSGTSSPCPTAGHVSLWGVRPSTSKRDGGLQRVQGGRVRLGSRHPRGLGGDLREGGGRAGSRLCGGRRPVAQGRRRVLRGCAPPVAAVDGSLGRAGWDSRPGRGPGVRRLSRSERGAGGSRAPGQTRSVVRGSAGSPRRGLPCAEALPPAWEPGAGRADWAAATTFHVKPVRGWEAQGVSTWRGSGLRLSAQPELLVGSRRGG